MVVYLTTNMVNGKKYIGKDSKNNPNYLGSGVLLQKAISKYGKNNFKKDIIEECSNFEQLIQREEYWLNFYNAGNSPMFYNLHNYSSGAPSGEKNKLFGRKLSLKRRMQISQSLRGRIHSEETKKRIRESNIGKNLGKYPSKETRAKLSKAATGRKHTEESKEKIRLKNIGNRSRTGMTHSVETKEKIRNAQIGIKKNPESVYKNFLAQKKKPIIQYDTDGNFLREYDGIRLAERITGIKRQSLRFALTGKSKTSGGFIWKYKTNVESESQNG
jgi:group I intron endonuclease